MFDHGSGPELSLCYAVMKRALQDASGVVDMRESSPKSIVRMARAWLFNWQPPADNGYPYEDAKTPFTFVWVCLQLDLCPYEMVRHARKLIKKKLAFERQPEVRGGKAFTYTPTRTEGEVYYG